MPTNSKQSNFDPGGVGISNGNIFGFPYSLEEAEIVIIPVPWDVTTSYQAGTSKGPEAILTASPQLDFADPYVEKAWETKIAMLPIPDEILLKSTELRKRTAEYIAFLEEGGNLQEHHEFQLLVKNINQESKKLNAWLYEKVEHFHKNGKLVGVLGGDHSTPLALMQHLGNKYQHFGILQLDAHADLRDAYENFDFSHASIMHNALKIPNLEKLVQVGIRDFSPAEAERMNSDKRVSTFYDQQLKANAYEGMSWKEQCNKIIAELPNKLYISFDIDGLDPKLCPNTGTPVPGGLEFEQAVYLIHQIVKSGKEIIGFDLCEVSPAEDNDWNENVGARLLYKMCILASQSRGIKAK